MNDDVEEDVTPQEVQYDEERSKLKTKKNIMAMFNKQKHVLLSKFYNIYQNCLCLFSG